MWRNGQEENKLCFSGEETGVILVLRCSAAGWGSTPKERELSFFFWFYAVYGPDLFCFHCRPVTLYTSVHRQLQTNLNI